MTDPEGHDLDPTTALPLGLTLPQADRDRFAALFQPAVHVPVAAKANAYLHILHASNGDFELGTLFDSLIDASVFYALPRQRAMNYRSDPRASTLAKIKNQFRFPEATSGEGGEVLLYSFLECHLNAPKLLSKLELKTSGNDYVKASDGVHLRSTDTGGLEIIYGESKLHGDSSASAGDSVRTALYDAFESMAKLRDNNFDIDKWLIEGNLLKEACSPAVADQIAQLLVPNPGGATSARNAFGVFIGYEIDTTRWSTVDMDQSQLEEKINKTARELVDKRVDYIRSQIVNHGLGSQEFHFYFMPFLKSKRKGGTYGVAEVREGIARDLSGKSAAGKGGQE